jgi:ABC-type dipeptide/oligopeptide/nickel transport system permease subunit
MTAIVKRKAEKPPAQAWAGMVLPGLGHILTGKLTTGFGLLLIMAIIAWAAVAGLPTLDQVIWPWPNGLVRPELELARPLSWHGVVSIFGLFIIAAAVWFTAFRHASPREQTEAEYNSNRAIFIRKFASHNTGMLGLFGVLVLIIFVVLAPMIAPFDPITTGAGEISAAPGSYIPPGRSGVSFTEPRWFLMGTDQFGRDVFSRVLFGGVISLTIGLISVSLAATIGTVLGATAAFFGGVVDRGIMWFVDLLLSLPRLVLLLAIAGMFRLTGTAGIYLIVVILGFTGWMGVCRIVRSQVLSLKQQEFIQAARALGFSSPRIVLRHLIPNALSPVIVYCSLAIGLSKLACRSSGSVCHSRFRPGATSSRTAKTPSLMNHGLPSSLACASLGPSCH